MKLYHIDRANRLYPLQILYSIESECIIDKKGREDFKLIQKDYYKEGLSQHGISYFLSNPQTSNYTMPLSGVMDIVFEYERLLNYPDKLSRYQSFFAFDKKGVLEFIERNHLKDDIFKIYEVESDYYEKHNLSLIGGGTHFEMAKFAKLYWENKADPLKRTILYEYLMEFPVYIVKEVKIKDLK